MNRNAPEKLEHKRPSREKADAATSDIKEPADILVIVSHREGKCGECGKDLSDGAMIRMMDGQPLCLDCADLGHLEFLPRGNMALTRRATKYSPLRAVVVQWARATIATSGKEYLRLPNRSTALRKSASKTPGSTNVSGSGRRNGAKGIEAAYVAKVTGAIHAAFPGCPRKDGARIAEWTCQKHSGRVGRSAAAKSLDPQALKLAVIAHIRHEHTGYDRLLMLHGDRESARQSVRSEIDRVLRVWESHPGRTEQT